MITHAGKEEQMEFEFSQPTQQERVLAAVGSYMKSKAKVKHGRK